MEEKNSTYGVETGARDIPMIAGLRPDLLQNVGSVVYLDNIEGNLVKLNKDINKDIDIKYTEGLNMNRTTVVGYAQEMPFADKSVNLHFLSNVIGADKFKHSLRDNNNPSMQNNEFYHVPLEEIVAELDRTLKEGGKIVIVDNITPSKSQMDKLIEEFKKRGIVLTERHVAREGDNIGDVFDNNTHAGKFAKTYVENYDQPDAYSLVFEKPISDEDKD